MIAVCHPRESEGPSRASCQPVSTRPRTFMQVTLYCWMVPIESLICLCKTHKVLSSAFATNPADRPSRQTRGGARGQNYVLLMACRALHLQPDGHTTLLGGKRSTSGLTGLAG